MNKTYLTLTMIVSLICMSFTQDKPAYILYNNTGENILYDNMINDLKDADIVFIGEYHNNPISHWLEFEITKNLHSKKDGAIVMGAEMFEADNQLIVDEFTQKIISTKRFESECKLWDNYSTDYEPLLAFARENNIKFVATNIPRRYASMVHKKGIKSLNRLTDRAKEFIAPLPIKFAPDSVLKKQMGMMVMMGKDPIGIAKAQTMKDATMAYFISQNLKNNTIFIHYNGTFHTNNREGIITELKKIKSDLNIKVISTVQQDEITELDSTYHNIADYIICVPYSMIRTY